MNKQPWYKWPATLNPAYAPWYLILRRLIGLGFIFAGVAILMLGSLISYGVHEAKQVWKENI